MKYKILGKTNLNVSVIGFGGIPIQRVSKEDAKSTIVRAEELGINFIDTARGYTVSEEYIGYALEGRRDKWIIATKSMARDKKTMINDIDISLKNLKTNYIDLYQFHNVKLLKDYEKIIGEDGAYQALEEAKAAGKIGHIGITAHSMDVLKYAIESNKFETIMYPYNIVETQASRLFKRAAELNIGVIDMKPLAGGALRDADTAIRYILENPNITTVIPGMGSTVEVEKNAAIGNNFMPLKGEERELALKAAKELGTEFCRRCGYCAPCTSGIDIPSMFLFEGYKSRYGLEAWAEDRYFASAKRAKDCVECGVCEKRCPYNLPIIKMLKKVRTVFSE